ncbi:MAG TPA: iron ABC transporter permease [Caproiciproducens sp.]|nr:iron ABC transporter permease [Caproiciproducens sp.]
MAEPYRRRILVMAVLLLICLIGSMGLGRYAIDPFTIMKMLLSKVLPIRPDWPVQAETVLFNIRLPRVAAGCVIGAGLSCAGCAFQGIFQNPMASPDMLGASNGAGFGAAAALSIGLGYSGISFLALAGGLCAVGVVALISAKVGGGRTLALILSGIMVGSLASAGISYLKLVADPTDTLPAITYWLMGSLASIRCRDMIFAAPLILVGMAPILVLRWKIGVLTMGDEEAGAMGINVSRLRLTVVLCATLITAACVSVSGIIGWVGLVVPHFARMLVGGDFRRTLPASVLIGGSFLMLVDNAARLAATSEVPIGILTAFVGTPLFLFLLLRGGVGCEPFR